jgi:hypothetical protein
VRKLAAERTQLSAALETARAQAAATGGNGEVGGDGTGDDTGADDGAGGGARGSECTSNGAVDVRERRQGHGQRRGRRQQQRGQQQRQWLPR